MPIPYIGDNTYGKLPINYYPSVDSEKGVILTPRPGLYKLATLDNQVMRAMKAGSNGYVYCICGSGLYKFHSISGTASRLGSIGTVSGPALLVETLFQIVAWDSSGWYTADLVGDTFKRATDVDYPIPSSIAFQDNAVIVSEADTFKMYVTDAVDASVITDLSYYATSESKPGPIVRVISNNQQVWVFKQRSAEIWYNAGQPGFPFTRIDGAFLEHGLLAFGSICELDVALAWLSDTGHAVRSTGGYLTKIFSTRKMEREWQTFSDISQAFSYGMVIDGNWLWLITFPLSNRTFVYNESIPDPSLAWSEWQTEGEAFAGCCYAYSNGKHLVGDYREGIIYELSPEYGYDNTAPINKQVQTQNYYKANKRITFGRLTVQFRTGIVPALGDGSEPQACLQTSSDGGETWGDERWVSLGKIGEYTRPVYWDRNGASQNRCFRITINDSFQFPITDWTQALSVGR